jgi:hypothetical protein
MRKGLIRYYLHELWLDGMTIKAAGDLTDSPLELTIHEEYLRLGVKSARVRPTELHRLVAQILATPDLHPSAIRHTKELERALKERLS